jgi:hypothetical protein
LGSRGENQLYKRSLLKEQGVEMASSVLDVGCGDLEVIKALNISSYVGIDQSRSVLEIARLAAGLGVSSGARAGCGCCQNGPQLRGSDPSGDGGQLSRPYHVPSTRNIARVGVFKNRRN